MKRTLVIRGGALGDFLLTLPAIQSLTAEALTLVTRQSYSQLLQVCGWEHAWANLESAHLTPLFQSGDLPAELAAWLASFDEIYAWMTDADGHFQMHLSRVAFGKFTMINPVVQAGGVHASVQLAVGLKREITPVRWPKLPVCKALPNRIAIHPGSGSPRKNWPVSRWVDLVRTIVSRQADASFLIIAGEADEGPLAELKRALAKDRVDITYAENLPLRELAPLLLGCSGYYGHDTGISHLAASLGLPSAVLFGPTDAAIWAPLGAKVKVVKAPSGSLEGLSVEDVALLMESTISPSLLPC
jgi:heptosyltransferase III